MSQASATGTLFRATSSMEGPGAQGQPLGQLVPNHRKRTRAAPQVRVAASQAWLRRPHAPRPSQAQCVQTARACGCGGLSRQGPCRVGQAGRTGCIRTMADACPEHTAYS